LRRENNILTGFPQEKKNNEREGGAVLEEKLELIATQTLPYNEDLYILIDFLNRTLKEKKVIFGVSQRNDQMVVSIYEI
jgi:uncharacterized FlaG/YvyC family protein